MKKQCWYLICLGLLTTLIISCGDDSSDDNNDDDNEPGDSSEGNGSDEENDTSDTESEETTCGGELETCCDGECDEGLDAILSFDQSCSCQRPCTFAECTAGSEDGYCAELYGLEGYACYNALDFPTDMSSNECVEGESCTTDSGDEGGVCLVMPNPMAGGEIIRCGLICDTPPEGCEEDMMCAPAFSLDGEELVLDYSDGHCAAAQ
jgi:hypothetical protein